MKKLIITILLCFHFSPSFAETVIRNDSEGVKDFASRLIPEGSRIAHKVIETNEWEFNALAIIAFYNYLPPNQNPDDGENVIGVLLVPLSKNKYEKIEIDTYGPEGRTANIESVFFAKSGVKEHKEMFVIVSWSNNAGTLYNTYVYERPLPNKRLPKLVFLEQLSQTFGLECDYCPYSDHPDKPAKYKTAADVKAELKRRQK